MSDIKALLAVENFGDIFKNSLMRVLLVASLTNIGSIVGAVLGGYVIMQVTGTESSDILFAGLKVIGL
jgi:pheromone shutdown protein TraB